MQQNVINYIPQTYRYRRPIRQLALFLALFFVVSVGILFGIFGLLAALVAPLIIGAMLAYALSVLYKGSWECRIEGDIFSFHRPRDAGSIMVSINEIELINELEGDRIEGYEFVMLDGKRMLLDRRLIGRFADFKAAMRRANSAIRFGSRDERICYACRGDLRARSDRCPECDAVIPGPPVVNDTSR